MRIYLKCLFFPLITLVYSEWVKLNLSSKELKENPSSAWLRYQQERFNHRTKLSNLNITTVSKLNVFDTNAHLMPVPQTNISGKIELPANKKTSFIMETLNTPIQMTSLDGFVKFLKNLQGKLIRKGKTTIIDKIKTLNDLKDKIIKNIGMFDIF